MSNENPWSKSSLKSLLEGCAWQWALQKLGGLPSPPSPQSSAGTGAHAALESHEAARISGNTPPDLGSMIQIGLAAARADAEGIDERAWSMSGLSHADMDAMVTAAVTNWWATDAGDGLTLRETLSRWTPVAVEPYFRTATGAGEIHGYMDWVGTDDNGWVVIDHKTASSLRRWPPVMTELSIESSLYLIGAVQSETIPADETVRMEWHVMGTKKTEARRVLGPQFSPDLIDFLKDRIATAERMVGERDLPVKPSWNLCSEKWCAFYHGCQIAGSLSPDVVTL